MPHKLCVDPPFLPLYNTRAVKQNDLSYMTVAELAPLIRERKLSPVELVQSCLRRIGAMDSTLHSFITVMGEAAIEEARAAEATIGSGGYKGPLHGIPIGLKDLFHTKGVRTTAGSRILADFVPDEDAQSVANMRDCGGIILGKLNMHEFAYGALGINPFYGTPANPWDKECLPGGSSSGSGVALMAGLVPAATGSDTGGSIRIPSSFCGAVGIKGTYGRVSRHGLVPLSWSLDHPGPMARSVEDCAILLGAMAGYDPKDPFSSKFPVPDYRSGLKQGLQGLRVGVPRDLFFEEVQDEVRERVEEAIDVLKRLGASVRDVSFPEVHAATAISAGILGAEATAYHLPWMKERPQDYSAQTLVRLESHVIIPATDYIHAQQARTRFIQQVRQLMETVDVLVAPTVGVTAPRMGESTKVVNGQEYPTQVLLTMLTRVFNCSGGPVISVPCGFDDFGLPVGLSIYGRDFEESTVFRTAYAYEQATEWHTLRPKL